MTDLYLFALDSIDVGIIIIDDTQNILHWNYFMSKISQIKADQAIGKQLPEICETFQKKRYQDILGSVFCNNQSRFCSCKLHKAFVFPRVGDRENVRQNMKIMPVTLEGKTYALIQIDDISAEANSENKLTSLINELKKGYLEVKESEEINRELAETDPLTKIANRHAITQYINMLFEKKMNMNGYALIFLDLDGFKEVNDTYGHLMGDNLLIRVADILQKKVRKDDVVSRLGGDEFVILLSSIENVEAVEAVGKKIISSIASPHVIDGVEVHVTASVGIALFDRDVTSTTQILKYADAAMYKAKKSGKNKYVLYEGE